MQLKYLNFRYENMKLVIPSLALFVLAMPLTAFCTEDNCVQSWYAFTFGWMMAVASISNMTWTANIFLLIAWKNIYDRNYRTSIIYSVLSIIIIIAFYVNFKNETQLNGIPVRITSIGNGYWLWLASAFAAFIGSLFVPKSAVKQESADNKNAR
jgi:uncharacterized membrane protein YoaT (DUF817 family)